MFKKTPGTKDILPEDVPAWQEIEEISRKTFSCYNYKEIRTPVLEDIALFNRSLGEATEIVQKQMFVTKSGEDTYVLRPEGTAGIARAYVENNLVKEGKGFVKFYYLGPMFRLERPQKGRLRQFHHIGCEAIGSNGPGIDVEIIALADNLLKAYGIRGYKIKLNSLGCKEDKKGLSDNLREKLKEKLPELCPECHSRYERNVLRVLDCKNEACQKVVAGLNLGNNHLCPDCKTHFEQVCCGLDILKVDYEVSPYLVRGLDYYSRTVFEIKHDSLGAQDAIGAGGRYDSLIGELGGPAVGAIGFAFGVERLLLVISPKSETTNKKLVYLIILGEEPKNEGLRLLSELRKAGIACDTDYEGKSLKAAMRKANNEAAGFVLIIGENELKNNSVMVKDMKTGEQSEIRIENIIEEIKTGFPLKDCGNDRIIQE